MRMGKKGTSLKKILLATDGSDSAQKATETVKQFLTAYSELQVIVLHVSYNAMLYDTATFTPATVYEELNRQQQEITHQLEAECSNVFANWQDRVRFVNVVGYPSGEICRVAEEEHADLIVVGSHGKSAVDRLLLGSVSHGVLNHAKVSVLVVR